MSTGYRPDADGSKDPLAHCYGQGCVTGSVSKDLVCFSEDSNTCINNAVFLAVDQATDIEKDAFSGVIGLGPKSDVGRIPTFLDQIQDGIGGVGGAPPIKPIFSIFLSNSESQPGNIIFGGYDLKSNAASGKQESDIFWSRTAHKNDFFWTL